MPTPPASGDFRKDLTAQLARAEKRGAHHVEINSGELHRAVGDYPGPKHWMPICCEVMYREQGKGAGLTIRYKLPRSTNA